MTASLRRLAQGLPGRRLPAERTDPARLPRNRQIAGATGWNWRGLSVGVEIICVRRRDLVPGLDAEGATVIVEGCRIVEHGGQRKGECTEGSFYQCHGLKLACGRIGDHKLNESESGEVYIGDRDIDVDGSWNQRH